MNAAPRETIDVAPRETLESLPVQRPADPHGPAQARARFFNSGNAFNRVLPRVPAAVFAREASAALAAASTGFIACDQSRALDSDVPCTTPLMLARYAVVAPHETLAVTFAATGAIWYVIAGSGTARVANESFSWSRGDVFLTPGGVSVELAAGAAGARLWVVTNEPQVALDGLAAPADGDRVPPVHYPAGEIARQLERVVAAAKDDATAGIALIFSSERGEASRNILPSLTLSLNTVPPGERQRAHRHNSAAITLILAGERCYSLVDGARCEWSPFATLVTPATEPHSHHNDGSERGLFLIVQDGGLYYHARTMGFTFLEAPGA